MKTLAHYPFPPITEAIIDLRVKPSTGVDHSVLKRVSENEQANYPDQEELFEAVGEMAVGPGGGSASVHRTSIGWKFTSQDGKQIGQSRVNGFTFSRLAPYDRWESFRDEAKRLWSAYREIIRPDGIERLAVRYINRIDIPGEMVDLKEYLRTSPEIAPELPQQLEGFFMQLQMPFPTINAICLVNETIVPPARNGIQSVVLDIDLFRRTEVPQEEDAIWSYFEKLHETKNEVFEDCITDSTRRLFESCPS